MKIVQYGPEINHLTLQTDTVSPHRDADAAGRTAGRSELGEGPVDRFLEWKHAVKGCI